MPVDRFQDILPLVDRPSRYLGTEANRIKKDPAEVRLHVALAFPDLYEIGTSHFGIQILYDLLNRQAGIGAERVFAPAIDVESRLRAENIRLTSLESQRPLARFDIVGFSLLYELNYTNVLTMLDLGGIPLRSRERDESHPLVIAGGPCTCNPEPVADFFDAMVIGDGEPVILHLADAWMRWKDAGGRRIDLLKAWARIPGVYVPAFYTPIYDTEGNQSLVTDLPGMGRVARAVLADLDSAPFPTRPVVPFGKPVHDRLRIEVARGCTRGCRFCQAGMIYRPVRERSAETLLRLTEDSLAATGYSELSLLSLSTGDYGCIVRLLEELMDRWEQRHVAVSLPSLRAGSLTPELIGQIKRVRKTGFTIAPEAGSQRMRDIINKNVDEAEIVSAVQNAFDLGWQVIKLYFMVGLPYEKTDDVEAIVELVERLRALRKRGGGRSRRGQINVSVATFIPKPHTPFQWAGQLSLDEAWNRIGWLKSHLQLPGITFKWQDPRVSFLEGLWARGDRRLSRLLEAAYRRGCRFDGWSDQFSFDRWQAAFADSGIDADAAVVRPRSPDNVLPWDHIDIGVEKSYLHGEWERAAGGRLTGDCRNGECNSCGVCDFDAIRPVVFTTCETPPRETPPPATAHEFRRFRMTYVKRDQARFFGHLEMVNLFTRALSRAGAALRYSEGFHPKPKLAFEDALPIGMESLDEHLYLPLPADTDVQDLVDRLNRELPEGLAVTACDPVRGKKLPGIESVIYRVELRGQCFDSKRLNDFLHRPVVTVYRKGKNGRPVEMDLKAIVADLRQLSASVLELTIRQGAGKNLRPADIVREAFQLDEQVVQRARCVKLSSHYSTKQA